MDRKLLFNSVITLMCLVILLLVVLFSFDLSKTIKTYSKLISERERIQSQIKTWQSITEKFKGYKDGYLQLAILKYRLGEFDKASFYLNQALYLDPNYKEALQLQEKLKNY